MIGRLRSLGVRVHKSIRFKEETKMPPKVCTSGHLLKDTVIAVIPGGSLITVSSVQNRDTHTLLPNPPDMLRYLPESGLKELDVWYLTFYLCVHYFTDENSWFATMVDHNPNSEDSYCNWDDSVAENMNSVNSESLRFPKPLLLGCARYVRKSSVFLSDITSENKKSVRCIGPFLDALQMSPEHSNVYLVQRDGNENELRELPDLSGLGHFGLKDCKDHNYIEVRLRHDLCAGVELSL